MYNAGDIVFSTLHLSIVLIYDIIPPTIDQLISYKCITTGGSFCILFDLGILPLSETIVHCIRQNANVEWLNTGYN